MKNINVIKILALLLLLFNFTGCQNQKEGQRLKIEQKNSHQEFLLDKDWNYVDDDGYSIDAILENNIPWQEIDLPHTWNKFDPTDNEPGYRRDIGWYRKNVFLPEIPENFRVIISFEGVNIKSDIFVNGRRAGGHIGGYLSFDVDITDYVKQNQNNIIIVRADNSIDFNVIPSQKSDFVIYGGITRDVWLKVLPPVNINRVLISTSGVSNEKALAQISCKIENALSLNSQSEISILLKSPIDSIVSQLSENLQIKPGMNTIAYTMPAVMNPLLWSPNSPNLYIVEISIKSGENIDVYRSKIGFRWFEFVKNGPFLLNGKRLLLRGTHRHEEWAGYGSALPNELHRKEMKMIKEMGANFVRLAHYPQDPEVYKACDKLGLLVWDELPWCRGGMGGSLWQANTKRLFEEQIKQNYNHPSIILWSLGNELYWLPDFPGGDNPDSLRSFLTGLNKMAHQLDPNRLTTMRKYYDGSDITDVFSPSIWAGWYSGVYKTYEKALIQARKKYPRLFHAEYGGSSHVGRHTENPITGEGLINENEWDEKPNMINVKKISSDGDWSENYIVDLFDWHLMVSEKLDWFVGNAQWAFKDFSTPLRPENPIPYVNQKGLLDRAGNPKDAYYVFKSYWTTKPEFVYIESHTWRERFGKKSEKKEVCVYSNCTSVNLKLNGIDQGIKNKNKGKFPASGLSWKLSFTEGTNHLLAIGLNGKREVARDSINFEYITKRSGKPVEILLKAKALGREKYLIEAEVVDEKGQICPNYKNRVYFDLNGGGRLDKYLGTPNGSDIIEFASGHASIVFIPAPGRNTVIEARTQDFKGNYFFFTGRQGGSSE